MTGLPKKYAKMGFKKGWRAFKATKKKTSRSTKAKVITTAKRRRSRSRRSNKNKSPGMMEKIMKKAATPAMSLLWGYMREPVNNAVAKSKLGQMIPATRFADEVTGIGLAFGARKLGLGGHWLGRKAIQTVEAQEWGSIGAELYTMRQEKRGGSGSGSTIEATGAGTNPGLFV